jgi:hypothetical protein
MADIQEVSHNFSVAAVTLTTTTEKVVISAPGIAVVRPTVFAMIIGWGQLLIGTNCTHVTPRIRRGTAITDTLIGDATAEEIKTAAADREPFFIMVGEELSDAASVEYSFSLQQTGASANGTVDQAAILVLLM